MRIIDGAKASKRRKGVAFFVRHFPVSLLVSSVGQAEYSDLCREDGSAARRS
jgi:hypothetical protein